MTAVPSIAARVLAAIESAPGGLNTSQIYAMVDEAENVTLVSVTCRDLWNAGKVERDSTGGRIVYRARQRDLLGMAPADDDRSELEHVLDAPAASTSPAPPAAPTGAHKQLKLRVLDKLIALFAPDIADVLRDVRKDVEAIRT